jgi:hypothetical protein
MWVLIFFTSFVWNICHCMKKLTRYDKKYIFVFMYCTIYSCPILIKLEFSRQFFEKYSNIEFHENSSSGSRFVTCGKNNGRTDKRIDMTKLIVAFSNFASAPKTDTSSMSLILSRSFTHAANFAVKIAYWVWHVHFLAVASRPNAGHSLLILEVF